MDIYIKKFLEDGTSFPEMSYPSIRKGNLETPDDWILGKTIDDGAEDLWRIHDKLYNFSSFVKKHPGGESWLKMTKGTDITEAFESHHISTLPENMISKFFVKDASIPRHSPFTFRDEGFYRTLKRRVRKELEFIPSNELERKTQTIIEGLFIATLIFAIATCRVTWLPFKYLFCAITAFCLAWTVNCAHNFVHRKDNWRMYLINLNFMAVREWRVVHVLSHHLYTNTLLDLEMIFFEPFFFWMPRKTKSFVMKYGPRLYAIFIYLMMSDFQLIRRFTDSWRYKKISRFECSDLLPLILPISMYIFGNCNLTEVFINWAIIWHIASIIFGIVNLHAAHHHPEIFHDGDIPKLDRDWGLFQVDAVADRVEINNNFFMVVTHFGEHTLHHLFPTLDHSVLSKLHPVFAKTCDQFKTKIRMTNQLDMFIGYYRQLARTKPKNFNEEEMEKY